MQASDCIMPKQGQAIVWNSHPKIQFFETTSKIPWKLQTATPTSSAWRADLEEENSSRFGLRITVKQRSTMCLDDSLEDLKPPDTSWGDASSTTIFINKFLGGCQSEFCTKFKWSCNFVILGKHGKQSLQHASCVRPPWYSRMCTRFEPMLSHFLKTLWDPYH